MKKVSILLIVLLISGCAALQTPKETNIAVGLLLDEVQIAINEINENTNGSSLPPFKNAEVTLSTKYAESAGGGATLVLSAKGSKSTAQSNTLTLILVPNPDRTKALSETTGKKIAQYVIEAVKAIDDKNQLKLKKLTIEAGIEVIKTKEGGIEVELIGVAFDGKKSDASTTGHKLKLIFEAKKAVKPKAS